MFDIDSLINHPERLSRDTLYVLRSLVARYPFFQTARLLLLQNLYILHEPDFGKELKRSVFYIADRRALWQMMQGISLDNVNAVSQAPQALAPAAEENETAEAPTVDRTLSLIDAFLESLPEQPQSLVIESPMSVDYMSSVEKDTSSHDASRAVAIKPAADEGVSQESAATPSASLPDEEKTAEENAEETRVEPDFFTETLARIYIKQKKYDRALEIIRSLYLNFPEKNIYFADQIRFLEKLVKNNNSKKID
ncbi:MAG: tetratricopeptide repeat protein [Bacteroidaceae bacterium]|nr:tetratricopeptide repeat protein [Bacteroidaceae bacterium]